MGMTDRQLAAYLRSLIQQFQKAEEITEGKDREALKKEIDEIIESMKEYLEI
ncbi:MAG: hypothetical protein LBM87_00940 [Ruminococcus sp.]|jgi:hypothetical protein|nr:hypothetical protein [Ruminococcus sp.]